MAVVARLRDVSVCRRRFGVVAPPDLVNAVTAHAARSHLVAAGEGVAVHALLVLLHQAAMAPGALNWFVLFRMRELVSDVAGEAGHAEAAMHAVFYLLSRDDQPVVVGAVGEVLGVPVTHEARPVRILILVLTERRTGTQP